jgi:ATP-dependent exoDNAse (exonuclease V) alpha subunit
MIGRSSGRSAVGAAAYRAGENITNEYDGLTHDYTRKMGVVHTQIMLPENTPKEYQDRAKLWNAVEKKESAKNSVLAREYELALPVELSRAEQIKLVQDYVKSQFVNNGMCADIAIHDKKDGNPHAHIMLTVRPFEKDGTWGEKTKKEYILDRNGNKQYDPVKQTYKSRPVRTTNWEDKNFLIKNREKWAELCNCEFEKKNISERIDHRTLAAQGITSRRPQIHLGAAAHQMEKRGEKTDRGNINRESRAEAMELTIKLKASNSRKPNATEQEGNNLHFDAEPCTA